MTAASLVAIFLIPLTFYVVERLAHRKARPDDPAPGGAAPPASGGAQEGGRRS